MIFYYDYDKISSIKTIGILEKKKTMASEVKKPIFFILRGVPGSGKTTLANHLKVTQNCVTVAADDCMVDRYGQYRFDPSKLSYAHTQCLAKVKKELSRGNNVVLHNTMRTAEEMSPYCQFLAIAEVRVLKMTKEYGTPKNIPNHVMNRHRNEYEPIPGERRGYFDLDQKLMVFEE